jgi:hypothetical protein
MNAVAAGTTDQNSSSVDMKGFAGCQFVAMFGAITATAVTSVKVQTSSDDSTFNDLEGTSITVADDDDNQAVVVDIGNPQERYLRCTIDRGTANAVIDGVIALQYLPDTEPVTHDTTTVVGSEFHHAPAEGTA